MSNIHAVNADGVHELMVIGSALKNAKAIIDELPDQDSQLLQLDEAIAIIEQIVDEGFVST